jgi:hypothetical protein
VANADTATAKTAAVRAGLLHVGRNPLGMKVYELLTAGMLGGEELRERRRVKDQGLTTYPCTSSSVRPDARARWIRSSADYFAASSAADSYQHRAVHKVVSAISNA